jgi:hypothetical protein
MRTKGLKYQSSKDRQAWEDFCQRLGASVRTGTIVLVLDDCRKNPKLSNMLQSGARRLLEAEINIATVHRERRVLPC